MGCSRRRPALMRVEADAVGTASPTSLTWHFRGGCRESSHSTLDRVCLRALGRAMAGDGAGHDRSGLREPRLLERRRRAARAAPGAAGPGRRHVARGRRSEHHPADRPGQHLRSGDLRRGRHGAEHRLRPGVRPRERRHRDHGADRLANRRAQRPRSAGRPPASGLPARRDLHAVRAAPLQSQPRGARRPERRRLRRDRDRLCRRRHSGGGGRRCQRLHPRSRVRRAVPRQLHRAGADAPGARGRRSERRRPGRDRRSRSPGLRDLHANHADRFGRAEPGHRASIGRHVPAGGWQHGRLHPADRPVRSRRHGRRGGHRVQRPGHRWRSARPGRRRRGPDADARSAPGPGRGAELCVGRRPVRLVQRHRPGHPGAGPRQRRHRLGHARRRRGRLRPGSQRNGLGRQRMQRRQPGRPGGRRLRFRRGGSHEHAAEPGYRGPPRLRIATGPGPVVQRGFDRPSEDRILGRR